MRLFAINLAMSENTIITIKGFSLKLVFREAGRANHLNSDGTPRIHHGVVCYQGQEARLPAMQARFLQIMLKADDQSVSMRYLQDHLFPRIPDEDAQNRIRVHLSGLRKSLKRITLDDGMTGHNLISLGGRGRFRFETSLLRIPAPQL